MEQQNQPQPPVFNEEKMQAPQYQPYVTASPMLNPVVAVKTCLKKYFDFKGRARRSEYWWFMLLIVIFWDRSSLGFGTVFNMVLVGYYVDFFDWVWSKTIPAHIFTDNVTRWPVFLGALLCFIISAAVYINSDMGVAPYDALPKIITQKVTDRFPKIPKMLIRMAWDFSAIIIGILAGGIPVVGVVLMAIFLGPAISLVGRLFFSKNKLTDS
jgi:uncharacterized membrane protein YczE